MTSSAQLFAAATTVFILSLSPSSHAKTVKESSGRVVSVPYASNKPVEIQLSDGTRIKSEVNTNGSRPMVGDRVKVYTGPNTAPVVVKPSRNAR